MTEKRRRLRIPVTLAAVVGGLSLLWIAGQLNHSLAISRVPAGVASSADLQSATATPLPPAVSFVTVGLAGFRGLAADLLLLRALRLQDRQRYFELVQLTNWITALEPQFTQVRVLQAWNMAYNISVMMPTDEDRWRWVQNGISLLRDRGLRANPNDRRLFRELGWIFFHKIGSDSDTAAPHYKREWAKQMMTAVGQQGYVDYSTLQAVPESASRLLDLGLIPERMQEVDDLYGPLDWRVAETHSLYWAHCGMTVAGPKSGTVACERMVCQSMSALVNRGRLTYSAEGDLFVTSPNFDLLPNAIAAFERSLIDASSDLPAAAFANFLATTVKTLRFYRCGKEARELFDLLHSRFPSSATEQGYDSFSARGATQLPRILSAPEEEEE